MESSILFSLKLSLQVAAIATVFVLIAGVVIAYLLAMKNFRGKEFVDMIFTLPLVLPPTVTGYFLIVLFGRNGVVGRPLFALTGWQIMFTWQAAVLASFVVALPLMIKTARAAMESVDENLL
ncbi:MAG: ABC transporter permease subunit, partial [Nitrospiraceae bacterium]